MVAQRVVHLLEAVEVEAMHRQIIGRIEGMAPGDGQHVGQPVEHQRAVGQAGQRVVIGDMAGQRLAVDQLAGDLRGFADEDPGAPGKGRQQHDERRGDLAQQGGAGALRGPHHPAQSGPVEPLSCTRAIVSLRGASGVTTISSIW
jgi:hypothetical protein